MRKFRWFGPVGVILSVPLGAGAFGTRLAPPGICAYYLVPAPIVQVVPVVSPETCPPGVGPGAFRRPAPPYPASMAVPSAAPPSAGPTFQPPSTAEPPRNTGADASESKFFDTYPRALATAGSDQTTCRVTFWNLSGASLSITVNGRTEALAPGKSLAAQVTREFNWDASGRGRQTTRVPATEGALDVVIRR